MSLPLAAPAPTQAADDYDISAGARYGRGAIYANHEQFEGIELFMRLEPAAWRNVWLNLDVALEIAAIKLRNGEDGAKGILVGPVLVWQLPYAGWALEAGTRLTWLTEQEIGDRDLGGPWEFTSHLGVVWQFSEHLAAALRVQHTSNASIYSRNPGLDLQMVELRYRF